MPDFSLPLEYYLIPFLIIVGICLILIVVFMVSSALHVLFPSVVVTHTVSCVTAVWLSKLD